MEANSRSCRRVEIRDHVSVEIVQEYDELVYSIKENMENASLLCCICRVPENLCKEKEESYFPGLISIGPFHHGKRPLKDMEDHKWRYLNALFGRNPNIKASLDSCVIALKELEHKARKCYAEEINLESDEFIKLMLVDGCFIIELFLRYAIKGLRRRDDPLFNIKEKLFLLRCNMILLENQIPFFVLQRLFNLVPIPKQCSQSLTELALRFFRIMLQGNIQILQDKFSQEYNHLLDLVRHCYLPTHPKVQPTSSEQKNYDCATKLRERGIRFKKATTESLLDIKFVNGVVKIPPLKIHNYTETLLRNLIALEQCFCDHTKHITSYIFLIKSLIQSTKDVRLLQRKGILTDNLDKEEEIPSVFKELCKEVDMKDFYYEGLYEQVKEQGRTKLHVWCQKLKNNYSKTSLAVAGLVLAVLFLVLTFAGALFSVLSFTVHHF